MVKKLTKHKNISLLVILLLVTSISEALPVNRKKKELDNFFLWDTDCCWSGAMSIMPEYSKISLAIRMKKYRIAENNVKELLENQEDQECGMCLEELNNEFPTTTLSCNTTHKFHTRCIQKYAFKYFIDSEKITCPLCEQECQFMEVVD